MGGVRNGDGLISLAPPPPPLPLSPPLRSSPSLPLFNNLEGERGCKKELMEGGVPSSGLRGRNGSQPSEVYWDFLNTRNSPLSVTREIAGISDIF